MKITRQFTVNASADRLWEILGERFADTADWASAVYVSRGRTDGTYLNDAPVTGRFCETSIGRIKEEIIAYDPKARHVAYTAESDALPGFVKGLKNNWRVRDLGAGKSEVSMELTATLSFPFNILMAIPMKAQFRKITGQAQDELTHFAETGEPHPRTVRINQSKPALAARQATA